MKTHNILSFFVLFIIFVLFSSIIILIIDPIFAASPTPKVGVYYYPWYSGNWTRDHSNCIDTPVLGYYNSSSQQLITNHTIWLNELGVDFMMMSWWGINCPADKNTKLWFARAETKPEIAIMIEPYNESYDQSGYNFTAMYNYIYANYATKSRYFKLYGRPLLCFYNGVNLTKNGYVPPDNRFEMRIIGHSNYTDWIYCSFGRFGEYCGRQAQELCIDGEMSVIPRLNFDGHSFDPTYAERLYQYEWDNVSNYARSGLVNIVMIATWNEYAERSQIEPTIDRTSAFADPYYLFKLTKSYIAILKSPITWKTGYNKGKALSFLKGLYNNTVGLASEFNGSKTYWIYNDNALLFQILNINGDSMMHDKIGTTINDYGKDYDLGNNRIEVLFNKTISYPPYTSTGEYYSPIINSDMVLGNNLVQNPSVENGSIYPDYWYHSDPNLIMTHWTKKYARFGLRSIGLNVTSAEADWRCKNFTVEPSANYLVRCYVEGSVISGNWSVYLRWFNSSQQWIAENFTQIWPGNYSKWTQMILFNFTCPSDARYADLRFVANGTGELYADDFEARQIINGGTFIVRNDREYIQIPDWQKYADLFVYGIIDEWFSNKTKARIDFGTLINIMCTPEGVNDGKSGGEYQTYKTALVLTCSKILNQSIPYNYTQILYQMQMPNGGFITAYLPGLKPDPNATENVETTCLALYALDEPPKPWIPEFPNVLVLLIYISLTTILILVSAREARLNLSAA